MGAAGQGPARLPSTPQAYAAVPVKPSSPARLLQVGSAVLILGAVLLLFGAIGAFYFCKGSDSHVSSAHTGLGVRGARGWRRLGPAHTP